VSLTDKVKLQEAEKMGTVKDNRIGIRITHEASEKVVPMHNPKEQHLKTK